MGKIKQKLYRFMYGRYGIDELYHALMALWAILIILNAFIGSPIIYLLDTAVVIIMIWRSMSRNIGKRRAENERYLRLIKPIKNYFSFQRDKFRDRKSFRYRKCTHCKAIVKLPNKKGKHTVICPRCRERFGVRI